MREAILRRKDTPSTNPCTQWRKRKTRKLRFGFIVLVQGGSFEPRCFGNVKKCEYSDEYILRLYETHNANAVCTLQSFKNIAYAYECDMMEENIREIIPAANWLTFDIAPYEIITLKVKLA